MKKLKTNYLCEECGISAPKWQGQCSGCRSWNTLVEFSERISQTPEQTFQKVEDINPKEVKKYSVGDKDLDELFGGGLSEGSVILVSGEPGIGKTTFLIDLILKFLNSNKVKSFFISGEEPLHQVAARCERLGANQHELYLLEEDILEKAVSQIELLDPKLLVIDSLQTLFSLEINSARGSVSQVKEVTAEVIAQTRKHNRVCFIIGHVNKTKKIAGPKTIEHMVDIVLNLEEVGEKGRVKVSASKNRFASIGKEICFDLEEGGFANANLSTAP